MLTDYHLHLRPDEPDTRPESYFTEANVQRYLAAAQSANVTELGVSEHIHRFRQALEIWDHELWVQSAVDDVDAYCEFVRSTPLRLGIEADWVAGREEQIAAFIDRGFDYVVGSVHFIGDDAVDHEDWDVWDHRSADPEEIWRRYFEALADAARSGLFDIIAHPDLVKVWGRDRPLPQGDLRRFYEPAVAAVAESGVAVELSTAGLRKPVAELYPARRLGEMFAEAGVPFALSSDAHLPEHVGYEYGQAMDFLGEIGVSEIAVFENRERRLEPLG